ncbi:MAG: Lipopolysaccharide assembly protein B [Turneriella sp.]|nr:Lipopolysaccharide assembly protein B [Turneriella sp.]
MREVPYLSAKRGAAIVLIATFLVGSYFVSKKNNGSAAYNPLHIQDERDVEIRSLLELLKLDNRDYKTHAQLAKLYYSLAENQPLEKARPDLKNAEKHALEAIRLGIEQNATKNFLTEQYLLLSKIYEALGESDKALLYAEKATQSEPTKTAPLKRKGRVLEKLKKDDEARLQYLRALDLDENDPETYALLANQEFKKKRPKAAMEWLKMGVRKNPKNALAFRNLARGFVRTKNNEKAKDAYKRALTLDPQNADLHFEYARFLKSLGDEEGYLAALKKAYALDNKNPKILAAMGDAELAQNNKKKALEHFRDALKRDGRNTGLREKYTKLYNELFPPNDSVAKVDKGSTQGTTPGGGYENATAKTPPEDGLSVPEKQTGTSTNTTSATNTGSTNKGVESAQRDIDAGKKAFSEKDYIAAEAHFKKALEKEPQNLDARYFLGRTLEAQGKNNLAADEYKKILEKDPNHSKANYYLGRQLYLAQKYVDAERHFAKAAAADEKFAPAQYSLGLSREKQGKVDSALSAYRKASEVDPALTQPHFNSAILLKKQGKYSQALQELSKAGNGIDVQYQRGEIYLKEKRYSDAKEELSKVVSQKPQHYEATFNLALVYHKLKDPKGADRVLSNIINENSPADLHYTYGKLLEDAGEFDNAEKQYQISVKKNPQYFNGWINLGKIYARTQKLEQAENAYRKALDIEPSSFDANLNLANTLYRQKKFQSAIEYFEAARKKENSREIILPLASSYEQGGQNEKAAKVYNDFLLEHPKDSAVLEHLAYLYYRKVKDYDKALDGFNKLLKYYPNSKKAKEYKGMVKLIEKQKE